MARFLPSNREQAIDPRAQDFSSSCQLLFSAAAQSANMVGGGSLAEVFRAQLDPYQWPPSPGDALPVPQEHDADERFA
jgi:hypothetical protein